MNIHDLRDAQARFVPQLSAVIEQRETSHNFRRQFVKHFTAKRISNMLVEEYVLGLDHLPGTYNFCYGIERELDGLGRILGSTAFKFGIYYGKTKSDPLKKYRFTKKFGRNKVDAFANVRRAILELS